MNRETEQREELLVDLGDVAIETKGSAQPGLPDEVAGQHIFNGALSDD